MTLSPILFSGLRKPLFPSMLRLFFQSEASGNIVISFVFSLFCIFYLVLLYFIVIAYLLFHPHKHPEVASYNVDVSK